MGYKSMQFAALTTSWAVRLQLRVPRRIALPQRGRSPHKTAGHSTMGKSQTDLFSDFDSEMSEKTSRAKKSSENAGYTEHHIEVLEGLEPVRRRPGMYIGGTDEKAMHHLFAEVIDNSMDEAVAGHATWIEVELAADGFLSVTDNGRGIPVGPHPKFKNKSALEVVMTHAARRRQIRQQGL